MELFFSILLAVSSLVLLHGLVRAFHLLWWRPRSIERQLRKQGILGTPYKFFVGDGRELGAAIMEAKSKPIDLGHQIAPRVLPFVYEAVQRFGKISMFWVSTTPRLVVQEPDLIKAVLSNKSGQFQTLPLNPFQRLIARGLSSVEGDTWVQHRNIINPAFHLSKLKGMVPAFCASCGEMINRWEELAGHQQSFELDVWPELKAMTADVISRTAFGSNYKEGKRLFELQEQQIALALEASVLPYIPGFRFVPTKKNRRRYFLDKEIKAMLRDLIHKKEQRIKLGECDDGDLLGLMLHSNNELQHNLEGSNLKGLTIEEVIEECKLFYLAGHETTSVLLTWTMILLSMYPIWQDRARQEVQQVCGSNMPNFEIIGQLKIVNMILHEVLRLYPPIAAQYRHVYNRTKLGKFSVPGGVCIVLPTLFVHRDLQIWGEDAEEFNPNRFSEGVLKASNNQFAFFPFGWGPRTCIGQNFAMIEAKIALPMILQRFSFNLSPSYAHSPWSIVTVQPQNGAQLILHRL